MATVISRVTTAETAALERMVQLYLHDFSEFGPFELNAEGLFSYPDLDLRRYRRREVGRTMAETCFRAARGLWQVRTDDYNPAAFRFWSEVIRALTGGAFEAHRRPDHLGVTYYFTS